jgi:hypothetical protein
MVVFDCLLQAQFYHLHPCRRIRRIGAVSKLMMEAGVIVLTAFISPFIKDRKIVRESESWFLRVNLSKCIVLLRWRYVNPAIQKAYTKKRVPARFLISPVSLRLMKHQKMLRLFSIEQSYQ